MRRFRVLDGSLVVLGERVPVVIVGLIGLTLAASLLGAVGSRNGLPLRELGVLVPGAVYGGQVWRLLTWPFIETDGLPLLFGGLALYWFGRDLAYAWGPSRFLLVYLSLAGAAAGLTCLVALFLWPSLLTRGVYFGHWPLVDALLIAWATLFPRRQMLQYFLIPMGGRNLVYFVVGLTAVFALLNGPSLFVPHFAAMAVMFVYLRDWPLRELWLRLRVRALDRRRRRSHLEVVERPRDEPPRWVH